MKRKNGTNLYILTIAKITRKDNYRNSCWSNEPYQLTSIIF